MHGLICLPCIAWLSYLFLNSTENGPTKPSGSGLAASAGLNCLAEWCQLTDVLRLDLLSTGDIWRDRNRTWGSRVFFSGLPFPERSTAENLSWSSSCWGMLSLRSGCHCWFLPQLLLLDCYPDSTKLECCCIPEVFAGGLSCHFLDKLSVAAPRKQLFVCLQRGDSHGSILWGPTSSLRIHLEVLSHNHWTEAREKCGSLKEKLEDLRSVEAPREDQKDSTNLDPQDLREQATNQTAYIFWEEASNTYTAEDCLFRSHRIDATKPRETWGLREWGGLVGGERYWGTAHWTVGGGRCSGMSVEWHGDDDWTVNVRLKYNKRKNWTFLNWSMFTLSFLVLFLRWVVGHKGGWRV